VWHSVLLTNPDPSPHYFVFDSVLLCSPSWPQIYDPPASASWVLGLKGYTTMLGLSLAWWKDNACSYILLPFLVPTVLFVCFLTFLTMVKMPWEQV
jgi:hypothetical protein